jgi:hypothetical protein
MICRETHPPSNIKPERKNIEECGISYLRKLIQWISAISMKPMVSSKLTPSPFFNHRTSLPSSPWLKPKIYKLISDFNINCGGVMFCNVDYGGVRLCRVR